MKKMMMILCCAAFACAHGAILKQFKNVAAGEIEFTGPGRIAAADVVSPSASGSVTLSRVVTCDVFTNAYSVTVATDDVISVSSIVTNRFFDFYKDGVNAGCFVAVTIGRDMYLDAVSTIETNRYFDFYVDGKLQMIFEEGGTNAVKNGFAYKDPMFLKSGDWRILYDRRPEDSSLRNWWILVDPTGATNAYVLAQTGVGYNANEIDFGTFGRAVERIEYSPTTAVAGARVWYDRRPGDPNMRMWWMLVDASGVTNAAVLADWDAWYAHSINFGEAGLLQERFEYERSFVTNTVVSVTTNSATPVLKEHVAVTNQLLNGSCSGGYYHGTPENAWMFVGDKLIFGGTAAGGTLRLVIE